MGKISVRPTRYVSSIVDVTVESLVSDGVKVVFVDFDNTLISMSGEKISVEVTDWIESLIYTGIKVRILSNNHVGRSIAKLRRFGARLDYSGLSMKPLPYQIIQQLKASNFDRSVCLVIGDGYLTDILAANLAGVRSILVEPVHDSRWGWVNWVNKTRRYIAKIFFGAPKV